MSPSSTDLALLARFKSAVDLVKNFIHLALQPLSKVEGGPSCSGQPWDDVKQAQFIAWMALWIAMNDVMLPYARREMGRSWIF